jgi:hypothetical protein
MKNKKTKRYVILWMSYAELQSDCILSRLYCRAQTRIQAWNMFKRLYPKDRILAIVELKDLEQRIGQGLTVL